MATLINGNGNAAVYAQQDADWFRSIAGGVTQLMPVGQKMAYEIEDANTIAAKDGGIITKEGRRIQIDVGNIDEFTIPTGTQGSTNYFILGYHLYKDDSSNELCDTFVQLMNSATDTIAENTFRDGATDVYVSLYRVTQVGLNIDSVELLLDTYQTTTEMRVELASVTHRVSRWLRFDPSNPKGLIIKAGASVRLANGKIKVWLTDTQVDFTSSSLNAGTDYFVFVDNDGVVTCSTSATPGATQVKIGRFHTLCVSVGTITMTAFTEQSTSGGNYLIKPYREDEDPDFYAFYNKAITAVSTGSYYNVATMEHPLSGFSAGDILPESVFCLGFKPAALYEDAMVYDKTTDKCIDVYLQSGKGHQTRSAYGAVHTVNRQQWNHVGDMICVGKELLSDEEFTSMAIGSNEKTNIAGSADVTYVGGHSDTASRRMISAIGVEEACGYLWQWTREYAFSTSASAWANNDGQGNFGQQYWNDHSVLAGGYWNYAAICGSRSRSSANVRSFVGTGIGGRGSSRVIRG